MRTWPDVEFYPPRQADWPEWNLYQEAEGGVPVQHHIEGLLVKYIVNPLHEVLSSETSIP